MKQKRQNSQSGYTLIGVLAIFTIIAVLGLSLMMLSITSVKTSTMELDDQSVFYIAEAGLNYKLNKIEQEVNEIYEEVKSEDEFYTQIKNSLDQDMDEYDDFEQDASAEINVQLDDEKENKYLIESIGTLGDQSRKVAKEITIGWEDKYEKIPFELPQLAVMTGGKLTIKNGKVVGNIGTVIPESRSIIIDNGNPELTGDVYVPDGKRNILQDRKGINPKILPLKKSWVIPTLPDFPHFKEE